MKKKKFKASSNVKEHRKKKTQLLKKNKREYFDLLGLIGLILLGVIIYSNSFDCSFHLDDGTSIVNNIFIRNVSDLSSLWGFSKTRFVSYFSFAINYHFGALNVWGYHFVNLIIHLLNACLVYWLSLMILSSQVFKNKAISKDKRIIALLTAFLFVSHPLATQSITYIVQRMASMVTMFYLLSIALYVKGRICDKSIRSKYLIFVGSFIAAVLAMLTKENAITIPVAILIIELYFLQSKKTSINFKDFRILIFGAVILIAILIIPFNFSSSIFEPIPPELGNTYTVTPLNYLYTQFSVIVKYIQLLFLPINLNLDYDFPIAHSLFEMRTLLCLILLLLIFTLAIFLFKKNRIVSFGIIWFFMTLSVESSIIPLSDLIFEHRTYLPSFGFFITLSSAIYLFLWNKYNFLAKSLFLIIIVSNSFLTYQRNKVWKNELTLWNDVISKSPNKARPFGTRGDYYRDSEQWNKAIADYTEAIRINPKYSIAYLNRGGVYSKLGQRDNSLIDYSNAIESDPKYRLAYYSRGNYFFELGQWDKAIEDYSKSIEIDSKFKQAFYARSLAFGKINQLEKAIEDCSHAIAIDLNYGEAYFNRGYTYAKLGQLDKAINDYNFAIQFDPSNANIYYNRGVIFGTLGEWTNAISDYSKAIEINPEFTNAYTNRDIAKRNLAGIAK